MAVNYKTFEERGVYVGFTSNILVHARCRLSKAEEYEFDAMIPNWAGEEGASKGNDLVMAFKDVPVWTQLDARDEFLHLLFLQRRQKQGAYLDPILARELRLKADLEKGDDIFAGQAKHELDIAKSDVQDAYIDVLAMFGRRFGAVSGQKELEFMTRGVLTALAEEDPRHLMKLVRVIIKTITLQTSLSRELLQERLEVLSEYAAPMCSLLTEDKFGDIGFLSRQNMRLEELYESLGLFAEEKPAEIIKAINVIRINIKAFLAYTKEKSAGIKLALLQDSFYLDTKRYEHLLKYVLDQRSKISFALDGWARHAENWAVTHHENIEGKRNVIFHMLRDMPTAPGEVEEEVRNLYNVDSSAMSLRGKMVKELHGWADDKMDHILQERLMECRRVQAPLELVDEQVDIRSQVKKALK